MANLTLIGFGEVIATFSCIQWPPDFPPRAARFAPQSPMGRGVRGARKFSQHKSRSTRSETTLDCTWLPRLMSLTLLLCLRYHAVLKYTVGTLSLRLLLMCLAVRYREDDGPPTSHRDFPPHFPTSSARLWACPKLAMHRCLLRQPTEHTQE